MAHDRPNDLQDQSRPFLEATNDSAWALVQLGMTVKQARVALAVMAPEGHEAAFALTVEYLVWRSARGLDESPQFERLVNRFLEQVSTSEAFPALWPFEAYRE
jgi:hypothetical protein